MPAADRTSNAVSSLSGRRLISRIASPFTNKSRTLTDFLIELDDPHRRYQPGDVVRGSVRLRVHKPIRVTHIVICLHGFVQVYKTPGSPGDGFRANSGHVEAVRGKKSGEYFGNGFATLFEDEVVLCGDGRLADGAYQFNFELEFPDTDLPSSIDFERGTISYMTTATMTRPTTLTPILTCNHNVYFVQRIDISRLYPPKPQTITLDPVSKRSRATHHARKLVDATERRGRRIDSPHPSDADRPSRASSTPSTPAESESAISPISSQARSGTEAISNDRLSPQLSKFDASQSTTPGNPAGSVTRKPSLLPPSRPITVVVESLTGGCLRGENVGIKVNINHTKAIRSLYGVIVTLYRHARVDLHPSIPLGPTEKGSAGRYEDYYPKSITGLGGLSLSGAGSSHVFRKDLSQVLAPLYVDPNSLTAEVHARIRLPDEAFPTISTVPGAMISFTYYVEVVLDIQGKLSSTDRSLGNLGRLPGIPSPGATAMEGLDNERSVFRPYESNIIDTAPIRRDKGVVSCAFEVVVGTTDSERRKGKRKVEPEAEQQQQQSTNPPSSRPEGGYESGSTNTNQDLLGYPRSEQSPQPVPNLLTPSPQLRRSSMRTLPVEDESILPEKERIRRAEARLLPSQPPGVDDGDALVDPSADATAPYLAEESDLAAPLVLAPHAIVQRPSDAFISGPQASADAAAGVDKQELERERLLALTSTPAAADDEDGEDVTVATASAPTLLEADGGMLDLREAGDDFIGEDLEGVRGLPRYER